MASLVQLIAAAQHMNFRHAAMALGVSQSSISSRIKALEQELGILLFERRARGVKLTEAGSAFVDEVAIGLDHIKYAIETISVTRMGEVGRLCVGFYIPVAHFLIDKLRHFYFRKHPGIRLLIKEGQANGSIHQLLKGDVDIAFVAGEPEAPECHRRFLYSEPLGIVLSKKHRLASNFSLQWTDVVNETFLVRHSETDSQIYDYLVRQLRSKGKPFGIERHDIERDTLMQMIADGDGIALTCASVSHVLFPGVCFLPIADELEAVSFYAVWSPHNHNPALKKLLLSDVFSSVR